MNRFDLIKKFISLLLIILYNIVLFFWCYIISSTLIYNLTEIQMNEQSIGIIGGAGTPTAMFIMGEFLGCVFPILFVILSIATISLLTVSIFKKQINRKLNILLSVLIILSLFIFMMIPFQTYYISFYLLVKKFSFLKYTRIFYSILSIVITVKNILVAIKGRRKRNEKIS